MERVHSTTRVSLRAVFSSDGQQEGLDISTPVVPPVSSVPSQGRQPPEAEAPVPSWRAQQSDEITGFRAERLSGQNKPIKQISAELSS